MPEVRSAKTIGDIKRCLTVMQQLRPHLVDEVAFIEQVQRQFREGYNLVFVEENDVIKALAGFRFLEFLAWGKVLYIDDLVTCSGTRGLGHGGALIKWLTKHAIEKDCDQLHLDSGPQRHDAHRLYIKHKMKIIGYHFSLDLEKIAKNAH